MPAPPSVTPSLSSGTWLVIRTRWLSPTGGGWGCTRAKFPPAGETPPTGTCKKLMTLDAIEFMRRFLLHILPPGFVKIRHCGLLANRNRHSAVLLSRKLLHAPMPLPPLTDQQ